MMQAAYEGHGNHRASVGRLDSTRIGRVAVERLVTARIVIIGEVGTKQVRQVPFTENDDVVEEVAADRADKPLGERILPR